MDKFEIYLWDMDIKMDNLYNQYIELCNTIDDESYEELEKASYEYDKKKDELLNEIRSKTNEELSVRYNLSNKVCEVITKYMGLDVYSTLSADFLEAKRYAEFARFVLDEYEKGE